MGAKKKASKTRRKTNNTSYDDEEAGQTGTTAGGTDGKDTLMIPAEKAIRATITSLTKMNTPSGSIFEWAKKNIDGDKGIIEKIGMTEGVKAKNRDAEIGCIEESRVKLKELPEGAKDYIHANYVKFAPSDRVYIATQYPLESTYEDFWRMVFYENVDTIIGLNSHDENLPAYYPTDSGKFLNHGGFFVNCRRVTQPTMKYAPIQYQIEILPEGCSNSRIVTILHYGYWKHTGLPPSPRVIMKLLRLVKTDKTTNGPIVVHCSNGTNRSSCLIFADIIVDLAFRNVEPDIPAILKKLRSQRAQFMTHKQMLVYGLFVFADYVRIRCKSNNTFPDLIKEVTTLQQSLDKEFKSITGKEPSKNATVEE